ncbi:MAG: ATP/GTP-binding protein [Desulfurococcaceae archaeon]
MPYFIIVLGTAGSGKSSLTSVLYTYLTSHQLDAAMVNLDPAVEDLPYKPDVDVRDYVDARDIMRKTGLGPNGALLASVDMLLLNIEDIKEEVWSLRSNYIVIDTPGQMEIFAFRPTGPMVLRALVGDAKAVSLFLVDSTFASSPLNLLSALLLSASTYARIGYPQINVLTKIDLLEPGQLEKTLEMLENPEELAGSIMSERPARLIWDEYEIETIAEKLTVFETVPISSLSGEGFDDLYAAIQRVVAGGEDYYTEEPSPRL